VPALYGRMLLITEPLKRCDRLQGLGVPHIKRVVGQCAVSPITYRVYETIAPRSGWYGWLHEFCRQLRCAALRGVT
jgi:hypothetical protein